MKLFTRGGGWSKVEEEDVMVQEMYEVIGTFIFNDALDTFTFRLHGSVSLKKFIKFIIIKTLIKLICISTDPLIHNFKYVSKTRHSVIHLLVKLSYLSVSVF